MGQGGPLRASLRPYLDAWVGAAWSLPSPPLSLPLEQPDTIIQLLGHILYRETKDNKNSTSHLKNVLQLPKCFSYLSSDSVLTMPLSTRQENILFDRKKPSAWHLSAGPPKSASSVYLPLGCRLKGCEGEAPPGCTAALLLCPSPSSPVQRTACFPFSPLLTLCRPQPPVLSWCRLWASPPCLPSCSHPPTPNAALRGERQVLCLKHKLEHTSHCYPDFSSGS